MQYIFTPDNSVKNQNEQVLNITLLKQYLRIDHDSENLKIQDIIDQSINYFQNQTGYIFRAGTLEIQFTYEDNIQYDKRKRENFGSYLQRSYEFDNRDYYLTNVGANVSTQKPSYLSFMYDYGEKERVLTEAQLNDLVPDNFFIVRRKQPLSFRLPRDLDKLRNELEFNRFDIRNLITCRLVVGTIVIPDVVKSAIIRMASALYENPDIPVPFAKDAVVCSALRTYNYQLSM